MTGLIYVTNGKTAPISAFEANKLETDEVRAVDLLEVLDGDLAECVRRFTPEGVVIAGTKEQAGEIHDRLFTLHTPRPQTARLGNHFWSASMLAPTAANNNRFALQAA